MFTFDQNASSSVHFTSRAAPKATVLINMRTLVIFVAILIGNVSTQRGVPPTSPLLIIKQDSQVNHDGSYSYSYETENGIRAAESGFIKNARSLDEGQTVQGSYSYTAPDGTPISVTYTADDNGFNAQGAHLPVGPELPPLIAKALAYNAAKAGDGGSNNYQTPRTKPKPSKTRSGIRHKAGFASGAEI